MPYAGGGSEIGGMTIMLPFLESCSMRYAVNPTVDNAKRRSSLHAATAMHRYQCRHRQVALDGHSIPKAQLDRTAGWRVLKEAHVEWLRDPHDGGLVLHTSLHSEPAAKNTAHGISIHTLSFITVTTVTTWLQTTATTLCTRPKP